MKNVVFCVFIVIITFSFFGCSEKNPTNPHNEDQPEIMPLEVGNSWTYSCNQFAYETIKKSVITEKTTILSENVNVEVYVLSWFTLVDDSFVSDSVFYYYKNEIDGLYSYYPDKKELIAKYPIELDESWTIPMQTEEIGNGVFIIISLPRTYDCISINEEVTTPIGTFECIEYVEDCLNFLYPRYYSYCPDLGLVRFTASLNTRILIDYHLE